MSKLRGDPKAAAERVISEADLVSLGRADLVSFSAWPLGYIDEYKLWDCQREWQEEAQRMYEDKLRDGANGRNLCILAPSEHGKTYGLDIPFMLWALARNRNLRIGVVGSKDELAQKIGNGIDRLFRVRGEALSKFGLLPGYPWNAEEKYLQRDDDRLLDPSIRFIGPDSELQGCRFDIIFLTDFATFKNQRSEESRNKLREWIFNTLLPRLEPWGFVIGEGHHVDARDIYTELKEAEDEWKVCTYRAIITEPCAENDNQAVVLAPEHWTYKALSRIRQRSPSTFQLIYQNNPVERACTISREVLERSLDRSRPLLNSPMPELSLAYKEIHMAFDLAFSTNRWSKYSVCVVVGIGQDDREDLLAGWRLRLLPPQLRAKLIAEILKWKPVLTKCHIEANAAQVYVVDDIRKALGTASAIINPVYTAKDNPETMPEASVGELVTQLQCGNATLPYGNHDAQAFSDSFMDELVDYPGKYTDCVMAWAILKNGRRRAWNLERTTTRTSGLKGIAARRHWRRGM